MLKYRIITGLILAPLAALAVFYLPAVWFALVFWAVAALGAYEWAGLLRLDSPLARLGYVCCFALLAVFLYWLDLPYAEAGFVPLLIFGCLFWSVAMFAVVSYPTGQALFAAPWFLAIIGLIVVSVAWVSLIVIRSQTAGSIWLVWMFCLVWGADIGAYFAGRGFGRRPLAPAVSPNKSWEGVWGGFALSGIVCGGVVVWWQGQPILWLVLTAALITIAVFGDLFESLIKRATGVKDSGNILPGHGGMLDRIDSILAVLPFFALSLYLLQPTTGGG